MKELMWVLSLMHLDLHLLCELVHTIVFHRYITFSQNILIRHVVCSFNTPFHAYTHIVASHLQRGSAIRWREDIEMDVAKISGGSLQPGRLHCQTSKPRRDTVREPFEIKTV